jgi:hypothetical protein
VYQAKNIADDTGLTSTVNPWPFVAASYQLPESAKSAFVGRALVVEHVTLRVMRVNGIEPARPDPSVKLYVSTPLVHESKCSVAVPTATPLVTGGALKLPPTLR